MALQAVVLYSSVGGNVLVENNQRALFTLLEGKKVTVEKIDGAAAANKETRAKLWCAA